MHLTQPSRANVSLAPPALYAALTLQVILVTALVAPLLATSLADVASQVSVDGVAQIATLNVGLGLTVTWAVTRTLWDPRMLLYLSLVAFNAGALIARVLSPDQPIVGRLFLDIEIVSAAYFVTACLAVWTLATVLSQFVQQGRRPALASASAYKIRTVGLAFLALGSVPALLEVVDAVRAVASGGYFALYQGETVIGLGNWRAVAGGFFIPGLLWLLGSNTLGARGRRGVLLTALAYVAVQFLLGHRSEALLPLIAVLYVWHVQISRIPRRWVVSAGAMLFFILLPAIAVLRQSSAVVNLSPVAVGEALASSESPLLSTLVETGGSILPTIYSIATVPEGRPFDYGSYYVRSLWVILPSFSGLNAAVAGGAYSKWLVQSLDPIIASLGGGLGFSSVAEAYVNFGAIGGIFWFLALAVLIQFGLARFSTVSLPLHAVITGVALYFLLFWPRSETLTMIRPLFWYIVIPAVWVMLSTRRQAP